MEFIPPPSSSASAPSSGSEDYSSSPHPASPAVEYPAPPAPNSKYNVGNFDYPGVQNLHMFENTANFENNPVGGGELPSADDDNEVNHESSFDAEAYPIPSGEEIEEINNSFKSADSADDTTEENEHSFHVPDFFEHSKYEDESLLENLPPFPPLPDLNINEFQNVEYEEGD